MTAAIYYGIATFAMAVLAFFVRKSETQKLAIVLIASFIVTNAADALLGFAKAPIVFAVSDAICALFCASLARRSWEARIIFTLYAIEVGAHFVAFSQAAQASRSYYVVLNLLYSAQLMVLGGGSFVRLVRLYGLGPRPDRGAEGAVRNLRN